MHTAIAEWLFVMLYLMLQKKRFSRGTTILLSAGFLGLSIAANLLGEWQQNIMWLVMMIICMGIMALQMYTLGKLRWLNALYFWSRAFLMAEFAASLEWQVSFYLLHLLDLGGTRWGPFLAAEIISYMVLTVSYSGLFAAFYLIERKKGFYRGKSYISCRETVSAMVIALSAFAIGNVNFAFRNNIFTDSLGAGVLYVRTLVDLAGIILLFAHDAQRKEIRMSYELEAMSNLMNKQYNQYCQYQKNSETLQYMYHDLKHQIAAIRAEQDHDQRDVYLIQMDEAIRKHEAATETGNTVLDTLLTSKNLVCMEKKITMVCFADAKALNFMDAMDICSIFGNALDNAIEYEEKIKNVDNRLIKVNVYPEGGFLMICIRNYCEEAVLLEGDIPLTTKADKKLHGYGIKSIRRIVQKYGGHVKLTYEDHWFSIMILLPLES